jgi:hypothetical protein
LVSFTLDTNCIIDIDEKRASAPSTMQLVQAYRNGQADVALVSVSASERQQGDKYLENYSDFVERLKSLGLSDLPVLPTIAYWNIGFYGVGLYGGNPAMVRREREIQSILFPGIEFEWPVYASKAGLQVNDLSNPGARRWRNAFCDRQMFWAHDHNNRDYFATRDGNFLRLVGRPEFADTKVLTPSEAASLI